MLMSLSILQHCQSQTCSVTLLSNKSVFCALRFLFAILVIASNACPTIGPLMLLLPLGLLLYYKLMDCVTTLTFQNGLCHTPVPHSVQRTQLQHSTYR